ncbi:hypothetical protein CSC67_07900 [Pusillimonas caeni]|uniref:type 4 pilus major pilin n=1 Tax=Pusillimonas caeni TaxID=1348472 RepID=UPI000E59CC73|nr:type 4 pilus major pilin [Pusillimonas caeni]TFL14080.1 hypothetical protein CSC67_07900 [Pusillimonas caeni]
MNQLQSIERKLLCHFLGPTRGGKQRERGMSVSSVMFGLIIVAAISLALWGYFKYMKSGTSVQIETNNLMMIASASKSLKSGGSYASVNNAALQRMQAFGSMTGADPGGTVRNGWNGTVVVTGTASELQIAYNGVPTSACDRFVTAAMATGEFAEPVPSCSNAGASDLSFVAY